MKPLRTIFAGTPEFAVPSLKALLARADIDLLAVYTQPDRRAGRGQKLQTGPIKHEALRAAVEVRQPRSFADADVLDAFSALAPDLFVVAAYGLILPAAVLDCARHTINVHASLLPRWRGAAPIQRAIMAGDSHSGISIMRIVERLDAGPVWLRRECALAEHETGGSLHDKLARLGGTALNDALDALASGTINEIEQDERLVTYAAKIGAADRELDFSRSAVELERQVRALAPSPGARARLGRIEAKILAADVRLEPQRGQAGAIVARNDGAISVATGAGALAITKLQPQGKQVMSAEAFINGYGKSL